MKILFLYTRLPDYFFQCILYLTEHYAVQTTIIRSKPDPNAPFRFKETDKLKIENRERFKGIEDLKAFCSQQSPDVLYVSGWADPGYRQVARSFFSKIPTIVGIDNLWEGTLKQWLKTLLFRKYIRNHFSHIWVTGFPQYEFAKRLGYSDAQILKGLYCADLKKFASKPDFKEKPRHTILYFGRLVPYKWVDGLVNAFLEIDHKDWQLIIVGNGPLKSSIEVNVNANITLHDFIQPDQLASFIQQQDVFCLPSHKEHWGVVVHEATAAGLPIIASDTVGAASEFVIHGSNGYLFESQNKESLKLVLKKVISLSDEERQQMGEKSKQLAQRITPEYWVANLLSVVD